jgi:hypothetical protein
MIQGFSSEKLKKGRSFDRSEASRLPEIITAMRIAPIFLRER